MSSESRSRRPHYNPVRDRRRIMAAILSLAVILIAISEARKPENWKWLAPGQPLARPVQPAPDSSPEPLEPDQVRIVEGADARGPQAGLRHPHQPAQESLRIPAPLLDQVEESRVGVRAAERPAYFAMLATARDARPRELAAAARRDLPFLSLMNDPAEHRGEVIWIEGELRRVEPLEAGPNDDGFGELYEGWLFTDEAGRTNPYRIVVSALPDGFPQGNEVRERVRLPAYFFKRYTYATAHGQHSAPMLIGHQWNRVVGRSAQSANRNSPTWWPWAIGLIVMGWMGLQWSRHFLLSQSRPSAIRPRPESPETVGDLSLSPEADPREFLAHWGETRGEAGNDSAATPGDSPPECPQDTGSSA